MKTINPNAPYTGANDPACISPYIVKDYGDIQASISISFVNDNDNIAYWVIIDGQVKAMSLTFEGALQLITVYIRGGKCI